MTRSTRRTRERGFSAVLILAIVVLMGGMLAYAVTLAGSMHASLAQEVAQTRAAQAAQAGLEWGRYRIRAGAAASCVAATTLAMPLSSGPMSVTVRCTATGVHTEGAATVRTYSLSANACSAPVAGACPNAATPGDYVERQAVGIAER